MYYLTCVIEVNSFAMQNFIFFKFSLVVTKEKMKNNCCMYHKILNLVFLLIFYWSFLFVSFVIAHIISYILHLACIFMHIDQSGVNHFYYKMTYFLLGGWFVIICNNWTSSHKLGFPTRMLSISQASYTVYFWLPYAFSVHLSPFCLLIIQTPY